MEPRGDILLHPEFVPTNVTCYADIDRRGRVGKMPRCLEPQSHIDCMIGISSHPAEVSS